MIGYWMLSCATVPAVLFHAETLGDTAATVKGERFCPADIVAGCPVFRQG
jgi:hypothetical protein